MLAVLPDKGCHLKRTERIRQLVSAPLQSADLQQRTDEGWKLVAIEWEREVDTADDHPSAEVPFGLRIAQEDQRLEQNPSEWQVLLQLMELIVEEGSYARIADEINRRGFRTRQGARWTPISVFEMLPRLIEVGPQLFQSAEWQKRRQQHVSKEI
ncbi:MAG TPA: recombinase family protein [Terriglobales bacterium]|nr:recombinase family protein [Terriglobales bacterium]